MEYMSPPSAALDHAASLIRALPGPRWRGEVLSAAGMVIEAGGLSRRLCVGDRCDVLLRDGRLPCEVVGVRQDRSLLMGLGPMDGIAVGMGIEYRERRFDVRPSEGWIGRVVNALGDPIDGKGPLPEGPFAAPLRNTPPAAVQRRRVGTMIDTGIRVVDAFTPLCRGQRMGIFAGSGVGKSSLLAMLARSSDADVNVIGLIGERGREVQEFLERDLGRDGLAKSIVVVATSDESPLARRQAAYLTMALAEDRRKAGAQVLCLMDSVTRFAHALREIGLAVGEPPSARGYPPSVFAELARLLERAGPGIQGQGDVTLVSTVLVDGDDHDEPIGDAVRGILDGHIVLSRRIAAEGRYPAVDVPVSLSRLAPDCYPSDQARRAVAESRRIMALFEEKRDIIQLGLYKPGADPQTDRAIERMPTLTSLMAQSRTDRTPSQETFSTLATVSGVVETVPAVADDDGDTEGCSAPASGDRLHAG